MTPADLPFQDAVTEQSPALLRTAYLLTGGRRAARDLLQIALVAASRRWDPTLDGEQTAALLRRELVTAHAGWRSRLRLGDLIADSPLLAGTRGLPGFAQPPPDIGPRDELSAALAQLPPRERVALVLRHGSGLSEQATADALGSPAEEVPELVGRGLRRLAELLGGGDAGAGEHPALGEHSALGERLSRELPARAAELPADPADAWALARDGVRTQRRHVLALSAVASFVVLVALLVALTV